MDIFSNLQVIGECLLDRKRVFAFKRAIFQLVKEGDVVLDAGTGSGILALFAVKAGAKKVYAAEIASDIAKIARQNAIANNYRNIRVINGNVKNLKFREKINVVIMEMLDTGLAAEQQSQVINNLHKRNIIDSSTIIIPYRMDSFLQLLDYDFDFYGFKMPFIIQARNYGANKQINNIMSDKKKYDSVIFAKPIKGFVNIETPIRILRGGFINALRLKSRIFLSPHIKTFGTSDMNMPVIIPINKIFAKKGETVRVYIEYRRGEGFNKIKVGIKTK